MPVFGYTLQINHEPTRKYGGDYTIDLDGCSVQEAISILQELEFPSSCTETILDVSSCDDYTSTSVTWYRMETPEEVAARVASTEAYNQTVRQRRREEYEKLRQEFEGEV